MTCKAILDTKSQKYPSSNEFPEEHIERGERENEFQPDCGETITSH